MKAEEILALLADRGIGILADGDRIKVNAARGELTDDLKSQIAAHKAELLRLLSSRPADGAGGLRRVDRSAPLPLSCFQERIWASVRLEPESTAYNMVAFWKRADVADLEQWRAAIIAVIERHEILRSSYPDEGGIPSARVLPPGAVPVLLEDLSGLPEQAQRTLIEAQVDRQRALPFRISTESPLRVFGYAVGGGRAVALIVMHHIAVDAWSVRLILDELDRSFEGARTQAPALQYLDYAAWERRLEEKTASGPEVAWWAAKLAGMPEASAFPPDLPPSSVASGAVVDFKWDLELSRGIAALVGDCGVTTYMALVATCALVLSQHSRQTDVVLGSPMGTREKKDFESIIGPFVNLLVLRLDLAGDPTFAELLRRVRDALLDAHEHRSVPFETLLSRLKPPRTPRHSPMFQVAVVNHGAGRQGGPVILGGGAIHEMTWFTGESDGCLTGSIEYRADLYSRELIECLLRQFESVMRAAVSDPARPISQISLLSAEDRDRVLYTFNATQTEATSSSWLPHFERRAAERPDAIAAGLDQLVTTYGDLNRRANQLARYLRGQGVGPGCVVALCIERSISLLVALLAVQKSGGCYVPLDPGFPPDRLAYMLQDSETRLLITSGEAAAAIALPSRTSVVDLDALQAQLSSLDDSDLGSVSRGGDPAYAIYTSGSTGRPKGVVISHAALANFLDSMARSPGLEAPDVLAAVTTISFDIAGLELYLPLMVGARVELVPREVAMDGTALAERLAASRATVLQATPSTWRLLVDSGWQPARPIRALCGGEALPRDLADALLGRVRQLWNLYGPTETTIWSTIDRIETPDSAITVGRPIANTQVYVLDAAQQPVGIGVPGEIWIGGRGVAIGYHRQPELTADRFLPDPYSAVVGAKFYRTGDLGKWDVRGRLHHMGRLDHQVKIRGYRIELGEIEAQLATHPAVRQAVVLAREAGPGDLRLVAYVVYQAGEDLTVSDVRRHLRKQLPDYMIPAMVVAQESLPLTPNGKIDRAALPDPFRVARRSATLTDAPAPGLEQRLAQIWQDLLKIDRVGPHDNFFELGGHSLLSLRAAARIAEATGWRMDPRSLFFQDLRQIAALASAAQSSTTNPAPP